MPRSLLRSQPKYRHFKPRNLAVVRLDGRDVYLGKYDSAESWEQYYRLLADRKAPTAQPASQTSRSEAKPTFIGVSVAIEAFLNHAQTYYAKATARTREYDNLTHALKPLNELFGLTNANEFGPKSLMLVRQHMIGRQLSRKTINARVNRIKRFFKWTVEQELVVPTVLLGLQAVAGLKQGRTDARETEPVRPVADEHVNATLPYLTPVVQAMVKLQRLTGMRPCEVVMMRLCDIERGGEIWVYEPAKHKNLWRGHQRLVPLGPKAQEILKPFLDRPAEAFIFSPQESEVQRNAERRKNRKSPMTPSQAKRKPKAKPKKTARDRYDTASYRRAIDYGVKIANKKRKENEPEIPAWFPLQLRHTRATEVRRGYGLDGAQSALGHKNADVTQVYAEKNLELAVRIAKETG
jgi:integrase